MYMETPDLITTDAEKPGRRTKQVWRPGFLYLFLAENLLRDFNRA